MESFIKVLETNVLYIFTLCITLIIMFAISFIKESGKINALLMKNKKLTEETESIKKSHQLDLDKRKYQYESKKEQYITFFKKLDEFTNEQTLKNREQLIEILSEYDIDYLNAIDQNEKLQEATAKFIRKMRKLTFESYAELIKLKQETNTIRLIASEEIINQLDLLEFLYEELMSNSDSMIINLSSIIISENPDEINKNQQNLVDKANEIQIVKNAIIKIMRKELNEI